MRAQIILANVSLILPLAYGTPLHRRIFHPRQDASSKISLTSTASVSTEQANAASTNEPCIATHIASPSTTCQEIATQYGIQLSSNDTQSLASSEDCKLALQGYRLCVHMDGTAAKDSLAAIASPTSATEAPASNAVLEPTSSTALSSPSTSVPPAQNSAVASSALIVTHLTTFTFTQGLGASATVRQLVVTRLETQNKAADSSSTTVGSSTTTIASAIESASTTAAATTSSVLSGASSAAVSSTNVTGSETTTSSNVSQTSAGAANNTTSSDVHSAVVTETNVKASSIESPTATADSPVTMFSVSANVFTNTETMTNSYVSDGSTHVEEVKVLHASTEYSTYFSTVQATPSSKAANAETTVASMKTNSNTSSVLVNASESASSTAPSSMTSTLLGTGSGLLAHTITNLDTPAKSTSTASPLYKNGTTTANPIDSEGCTPLPAPAAVADGTTSQCSKWHVVATGETCELVAKGNDLDLQSFYEMNTAVDRDACTNLLAGMAYCVGACDSVAHLQNATGLLQNGTNPINTTSTMTASSTSGADIYQTYLGNGSAAAGWPTMAKWVDFETMFESNKPRMLSSCAQWNAPENTEDEQTYLKSAILSESKVSGIDPRYILAITLQESNGCLRAITTSNGVVNPGVMQSHNGRGTCNPTPAVPGVAHAKLSDACPETEIKQMVKDGVAGTESGDGLVQVLQKQGSTDDVSKWYRAARMYNGGGIVPSGDLGQGCCTACYASDVANRLTGWVDAPHTCTLTLTPATT